MIRTVRTILLITILSLTAIFSVPALAQEQDQAQELAVLLPHTDEAYGLEALVPEGWTDLGDGVFARQNDANDQTLLILQSALAPADDVLASLLPILDLTDAPTSVGTHEGAALTWTLYKVDVPVVDLTVDLALAHDGGTTYLAFLQAPPDEQAALHDSIFLPVLDAFAPYEEVAAPVPYDVEEVTFENGDHTLAGTLTLPPGPGPHPVIVLVSGSGPQDRDESLGSGIAIKPFRLLADALTRAGVAVLRYDDRGVGKSTGIFSAATTQDFASDAEAAIRYLTTHEQIDPDQIGLLGHSEGGLVAAMLGARDDDLDFIISLAGPGVNGRDVLLLQNRLLMEAEGATAEEVAAQIALVEEMIANIDDPEAIEELLYEQSLKQMEATPEAEGEDAETLERYTRTLAEQSAQELTSGWFEWFLTYDPAPDWAQTTVPVLAIFAAKDVQVDAAQNAPPLTAALLEGGNDDVEIVVLPNANHLFQEAGTGGLSEYTTLPNEFTPDLLPTITEWLNGHVVTAAPSATPFAATPVAP